MRAPEKMNYEEVLDLFPKNQAFNNP
jgi:hypothetical protein